MAAERELNFITPNWAKPTDTSLTETYVFDVTDVEEEEQIDPTIAKLNHLFTPRTAEEQLNELLPGLNTM